MDKTQILVEDLHCTLQYMYEGTATISFYTNESKANIWEIRGPKKDLVVMLHYQNDCTDTDKISDSGDTIFIKEESTDIGNKYHLNECSSDINGADAAAVVVHRNRKSDDDDLKCQPTIDYASQSTIYNSVSNGKAVPVQSTTCNNILNEETISHSNTYIEWTPLMSPDCKTYFNLHHITPIIEEDAVEDKMLQLLQNTGTEQEPAKQLQNELNCESNDTNTSHMEDLVGEMVKLKDCFVLLEPLDITNLKINYLPAALEPNTYSITGEVVTDERNSFSVECSKCRKKFLMKYNVESFKHIQTVDNIHLCPCCENSAGCKSNVNVHLQDHNLHCCSECSITFSDLNSYNLHMQNKHSDYSHCEKLPRNEYGSTEKSFYRSSHEKKLQLTNFSKKQKFICSREKAFECLYCDKIFCSKQILKHHELDCHTGLSQSYECFQCHKKFTHKRSLVRHKLIHSTMKPYECSQCNKKFYTKSGFKVHTQVHSGVKPYECFQCNKKFKWKQDVVQHKVIHSEVKPYECSHCNKKFKRKCSLKLHTLIHSGVKPYECFQCNKKFAQSYDLVRHKIIHSEVKPYECSHCNKKFNRKCSLKLHTLIHSGVKPYECIQCNKKYTQKQGLVCHKLIHSGVKPHECSQCNKKFTYKHSLVRHKLIHS